MIRWLVFTLLLVVSYVNSTDVINPSVGVAPVGVGDADVNLAGTYNAAGCSWTSAGGTTFDLSAMQLSSEDYLGDDQYLKYRMNICSNIVTDSSCAGSICSYWKDDGKPHQQYGQWSASPSPQWSLIDSTRPGAGVKVTFSNGRSVCQGRVETSYVSFKCDPNAAKLKTFSVREEFSSCTLTVDFTTPLACPGGGGSSSDGGLSGGSVFLILLFVLVPVYIAAGCWYNRTRKGQNGMEACPQVGFWRAIIDNAKAGCAFSFLKVKGWTSGGGNGRTSYQNV